jgi:hypothetical protein
MKTAGLPLMILLTMALAPDVRAALVTTYDSDAAFNASGFVKVGGGNVRWGNGLAEAGSWEYGVVGANDVPIAPLGQGGLAWASLPGYALASDTVANHQFDFGFSAGGTFTLALRDLSGTAVGSATTVSGTAPLLSAPVNTLALRARTGPGDVAVIGPGGNEAGVRVNFASGGFFDLARVVGNDPAQYVVLVDDRLAGGFTISDTASLRDGQNSVPMYQFKVGVTAVPVPAALPLMGLGLLALGWAARRRPHGSLLNPPVA